MSLKLIFGYAQNEHHSQTSVLFPLDFFCSPTLSGNENFTYSSSEICIKSSDDKPFVF